MNLTKEQSVIEHRRMWNWIAQQYRMGKRYNVEEMKSWYISDVLGKSPDLIHNRCFCCEYSVQAGECQSGLCDNCPIKWPSVVDEYFCLDACVPNDEEGLYQVLCSVSLQSRCDSKVLACFAEQIANLPEVE